jgi:hypothetical protein
MFEITAQENCVPMMLPMQSAVALFIFKVSCGAAESGPAITPIQI